MEDYRLLVTGARGFVGHHVVRLARAAGAHVLELSRRPGPGGTAWDLGVGADPGPLLDRLRPDGVIHAAAVSTLAACEANPEEAWRVNRDGTATLAAAAAGRGIPLVFTSTDQIFDGTASPYGPAATPAPVSEYGRTKAAAEEAVRAAGGRWQIARLALLYGRSPSGEQGASDALLAGLRTGWKGRLFLDEWRTPLAAEEVAGVLLRLLRAPAGRVWNVGGPVRLNRYELGLLVARAAGVEAARIRSGHRADFAATVNRPEDLTLEVAETAALEGVTLSAPRDMLLRLYGGG